jgi:ABC-type Na+ efflux pump permease subunit
MFWRDRTTSERLSLVMALIGVSFLALIVMVNEGPIDTGDEFIVYLTSIIFLAIFTFCAIPCAIGMLFRGGAELSSALRRLIDKVLPLVTLCILFSGFKLLAALS